MCGQESLLEPRPSALLNCSDTVGSVPQDLLCSAKVVLLDCMSVKTPRAIFSHLSSKLLPPKATRGRDVAEALVSHITSSKKMM